MNKRIPDSLFQFDLLWVLLTALSLVMNVARFLAQDLFIVRLNTEYVIDFMNDLDVTVNRIWLLVVDQNRIISLYAAFTAIAIDC